MKIAELPIPDQLMQILQSDGYFDLYPPQEEAVRAGVLDGRSLLVTSPTASGKTLIAILAAAKTVLERKGKVIYLTPLRALANEKYSELKSLESLKKDDGNYVKVLISTGDYDASGESLGRGDIIVLTNEKFDSVLRHGVSWLDSVKLFVADEVHLTGDSYRGPTLEMILTKILATASDAQLLALSATIKNGAELAGWLNAKLIDIDWRPVKLLEGVYRYNEILFSDGSERKVSTTNRGQVIDVAADVLADGGQALIFAETRRRAVSLSLKASEVSKRFLEGGESSRLQSFAEKILASGEETELSRVLAKAIENGSAFHHAGLSAEHRIIVEDGFRKGLIKILTATPTLAAGVNLPARRVVISSFMRYDSDYGERAPISVLEYKQMCGRAGRPKYDDVGETVLMPSGFIAAEDLFEQYVKGSIEPTKSRLADEAALRSHILATIASLPGMLNSELRELFSKTLFASQYRRVTVQARLEKALKYLIREGLVEARGSRFLATEFGRRVSMLYIDPATGVMFRDALKLAREDIEHTVGILHLVVSCEDFSPKMALRSRDWDESEFLLEEKKSEFIVPIPSVRDFEAYERFMGDFRSLLVMLAWIDEWNEDRILDRFGVEPGDLHRMVENANWLLYSLREVSRLVGRADVVSEADRLRQRVSYGVRSELLPLVSLEGVGRVRARMLYNAGYTDLRKLASISLDKIAEVPKIGLQIAKKIKDQLSHVTSK